MPTTNIDKEPDACDTTRQNASANASHAETDKENAYQTVLAFLEGQPFGNEYWCPKVIAETLVKQRKYVVAESTVRGVLKKLRSEGKVFMVDKGKVHLYASSRRFSDDFNYMFKNFGVRYNRNERYQIHGLHLQLTAEAAGFESFKNALPLGGGGWDVVKGGVLDSWEFEGGSTTVQLYDSLLIVQVNCSGCPMDLDRFIGWLAQLDGWLLAKRWPRIQGNLSKWLAVQYGFNLDYLKINYDKPPVAITLQGFRNWFYRVYDKTLNDGSNVIRSEIHSKEAVEVPAFLTMASGSMSYVHVMNLVQGTAHQMDNAVNRLSDLERALVRMASNFDSLSKELKSYREKESVADRNSEMTFKRGKIP